MDAHKGFRLLKRLQLIGGSRAVASAMGDMNNHG
jgi:hypothetical protein